MKNPLLPAAAAMLATFLPACAVCAQPTPTTTADASPPPAAPTVTTTVTTTAQAIDPEKEKLIRQLLAVMGYEKLSAQIMDQTLTTLKQHMPDMPEAFWTKFREKSTTDGLVALIVPIYAKYYTKEDISGMVDFYATPLGQKMIATLPQVAHDAVQAGQAWGMKLGKEVAVEVEAQEEAKEKATAKAKATTKAKPAHASTKPAHS